MYKRALRPLLFAIPPAAAHTGAFLALGPVETIGLLRTCVRAALAPEHDERLVVRAMGLEFAHPLGLAAGFDKDARRPRALAALGFAHLEIGTVTARPQAANPAPNLFRLPADHALVNRLGFPNAGAAVIAERLGRARGGRRSMSGIPVGVSIGKSRSVPVEDIGAVVADYAASLDAVRGVADFVVVNVSSPNTSGLRSMQSAEHARALLGALSERAGRRPVLVKIAPDLDDLQLEALLAVVAECGLAGVVATNTTVGRSGLATSEARVARVGTGGLSGRPLHARAVEVVRRVRSRLGNRVVV